ncbi:metallophosphoesterase family protein [Methanococcoides alaskense]|uniref:Calcineurin-like phosphoesterase domain-containing protein n=1 Tax=Methanococcoides alaskense TaxID=325778 RepID=A0AA90U1B3_9EURY|nr:metallophosphoesterase [Methanococcoides alaskense]MDR6223479.1 hypothetical protein [Methanococcoides alaskense]
MKINSSFAATLFVLSLLITVSVIWVYSQNPIGVEEEETWTFAVFCDTRGDNNNTSGKTCTNDFVVKAIAEAIVMDGCELVLVPGDMVNGYWMNGSTSYDKQFENWKTAIDPLYEAGIEVYTVRGNHEYGNANNYDVYPYDLDHDPALENAYIMAFSGDNPDNGPEGEKDLTYSFTHKNAFFMGLDEYASPHSHRVDQEWVDSQLVNNSKSYVFVFGHEPAFKLNHKDCLETYPEDRDEFWNSIGNAGCQVYFCGHDHSYNRARIQDDFGNEIYQMVVGSCGAPFKEWNISEYNESSRFKLKYHNQIDYGYTLVTVDSDTVKVEWKAWNMSGAPTWVTKDSILLYT